VLLVTLIIHQIITRHEKNLMLKKMNMVIGAFFSEAGTQLLRFMAVFDQQEAAIREQLLVDKQWTQQDFDILIKRFKKSTWTIDAHKGNLKNLRDFLLFERQFLLGLLENPTLLEHETFTSLLWAVFHLTEELAARPSFEQLPEKDYEHLANDIKRAYSILIVEWLVYLRHLHKDYPYLFSLAMRTNPFNSASSPIIKG
jgi:hypothetical protein